MRTAPETAEIAPPLWFWATSALLLLWAAFGVTIWVLYFVWTPEEYSNVAEDPANAQVYARYVANLPAWSTTLAVISAIARLFGAISLLLRRAWAQPLFIISLALYIVTLIRAFFFGNLTGIESVRHISIQLAILVIGIFAIWFAQRMKSKGVLT